MEKLIQKESSKLPKGVNKRIEEVKVRPNYKKFIPLVPKKLYETLGDGMKVYLVDGEFIRNNIYQDWTEGGNPEAYPEFNPEGEIWIEKGMSKLDTQATIIHEHTECGWMRKGLLYENAHNKANIQEKKYRDSVNPVMLIKKKQQGGSIDWLKKPEPKRDWLVDWTKKNFPKISAYGEMFGSLPNGINPIKVAQFAGDLTGVPGLVNAVAGNPMNLPPEEVEGAILPVVGKASQLTMGLEGAIKPKNSRVLYNMISNEPERKLTEKEVGFLQDELSKQGVLEQQKTSNFPGKDKVTEILSNSVEPHGYDVGSTLKNIKNYILHPETREDIMKDIDFNNNYSAGRNRMASWNTYLGKAPVSETQPFEISTLSTNKNPVYTIKPNKMELGEGNIAEDNGPNVKGMFEFITQPASTPGTGKNISDYPELISKAVTPGYEKRIQDLDEYAGIMGGFGWDMKELPTGNVEFLATDKWDLHPGQGFRNSSSKVLRTISPLLSKIEAGSTLGIGKPMDIRTGFEWNPVEKSIVRHFKKGGRSINKLKSKQNGKD